MIIYRVKKGDSLYSIGKTYNTTVSALQKANGLDNPSQLSVGQNIIIPLDNTLYTVESGDSLYSIALQFGISTENLIEANPSLRPPYLIYPDQQINIPKNTGSKSSVKVNGYAYPNINTDVLKSTLPYLTYLSIFSHSVNPDGSLNFINDTALIKIAKEYKTAPVMVITNTENGGGFRSEIAQSILNNKDIQKTLIDNIITTSLQKGYKGVDVDFEYVFPEDKDAYNNFLSELKMRLEKENLTLSTAIAPKISDFQQGTLYEAHDYAHHGKLDDYVIIMTYEWGYLYGPPMAVAPYNEVKKVISYAVTKIPSEKILMGMPNYAYDWTLPYVAGRPAEILSLNVATKRAFEKNAEIEYSNSSKAPFYRYSSNGKEHIVWFENADSISQRLNLINDFRLGGLSYWTVNQYFQPNWTVVNDMFQIEKVL